MEGFQSKFSNSETHQILDCSTNLKTPRKDKAGKDLILDFVCTQHVDHKHWDKLECRR